MNTSNWKDVSGFEKLYEIHHTGVLRGKAQGLDKAFEVKQQVEEDGQRVFLLIDQGETTVVPCHELVMDAFRGATPEDHYIRHVNKDTSDNRTANLIFWPIEGRKGVQTTITRVDPEEAAALHSTAQVIARAVAAAVMKVNEEFDEKEPEVGVEEAVEVEVVETTPAVEVSTPELVVIDKDITHEKSGQLSADSLELIFRLRYDEKLSYGKIAKQVGVATQTISNAINGRTFKEAGSALRAKYGETV